MNETTYRFIDLQSIKEDTFGDQTMLRMVIELFIEGIDEYTTTLNSELPNKNWQALFQATHKLKPNISMFGVFSLESAFLELESCFRNEENLHKVDELAQLCLSTFEQVKVELQSELKTLPDE